MQNLYEGFSERLNKFLDEKEFTGGRSRCSAIEKTFGVSRFTAQRMVKHDTPPKDSTLCTMLEQLDSALDIRQITAHLLYGVGPEQFLADKNVFLVSHIYMAIEARAEALDIDASTIPTGGLETMCSVVYQNAIQNQGKIDQKLIINQLLEFLPE